MDVSENIVNKENLIHFAKGHTVVVELFNVVHLTMVRK